MDLFGWKLMKVPNVPAPPDADKNMPESPKNFTQPPTTEELKPFYFGDSDVLPDEKVFMPTWMMNPPYGLVRMMRNGEVFNAREIKLLGRSAAAWQCKKLIMDAVLNSQWDILPFDPKHPDTKLQNQIKLFLQRGAVAELPCLESWYSIMSAFVMDLLELDAGILVKVFSATVPDKLVRLHCRDGSTIFKQTDLYGNIMAFWQYYYGSYSGSGGFVPTPVKLDPREIVYVLMNARGDSVYGESPLESIRIVLRGLLKGSETQELIYRKGGIPSGLMSLEGMSKEDFDTFKKWWTDTMANKAYQRAMVNVPAKFAPLITNFRDLQFLETQHWYTELVYRTFKCPPEGLGVSGRVTKGVETELVTKFMSDTIVPILRRIEEAMNQQVLPHFFKQGEYPTCYFHYPAMDNLAEGAELEVWLKKWEWGAATINDFRAQRKLDPVSWGDYNPMMLKSIQQVSQGLWYGAFDQEAFAKITGVKSKTPMEILAKVQQTQGASKSSPVVEPTNLQQEEPKK